MSVVGVLNLSWHSGKRDHALLMEKRQEERDHVPSFLDYIFIIATDNTIPRYLLPAEPQLRNLGIPEIFL